MYGLYCTCVDCGTDAPIKYVGQSVEGAQSRFSKHRHSAKVGKPWAVTRWMAKHGVENIQFQVLDRAESVKELDEKEVYWISNLGTLIEHGGYNISPGGHGNSGYSHPADAKSRKKGPKHSEETKKKISQALTGRFGEKSTRTNLKEYQVQSVIDLYWAGETISEVSANTGIKDTTVMGIVSGLSWTQLPRPTTPRVVIKTGRFTAGMKPATTKLTPEKVLEIRRRYDSGEKTEVIAYDFGVTGGNVSMIGRRKTWRSVPEEE